MTEKALGSLHEAASLKHNRENSMDFLKLLPSLFLDLISKAVPGFGFLLVYQGRYLPPSDLVLQTLSLTSLPQEWSSWYRIGMVVLTSYFIGVFIAILANAADALLVKHVWYKRYRDNPSELLFSVKPTPELSKALKSSVLFEAFVDQCRDAVSLHISPAAVLLEKHRTVYRLFFGLTILSLSIPFGVLGASWSFLLVLAPLFGFLTVHMNRDYLRKSIQFHALLPAAKNETQEKRT
jgi:hypothetical protein